MTTYCRYCGTEKKPGCCYAGDFLDRAEKAEAVLQFIAAPSAVIMSDAWAVKAAREYFRAKESQQGDKDGA